MELNTEIKGQGYPILCLHGHPGCAATMSVFTSRLSQKYLTIAPDLRGYGQSYCRQDFLMEEHLTDVLAMLERHNIDQCLILGWSLGGIIAMELALAAPEKFTGLILIATSAHPLSDHPQETKLDLIFTGISGILNLLKPGWLWNINTFGKRSLFRYLINNHRPDVYRYLAREGTPAYLKTSKFASRALFRAIRQGYNRLEDLTRINIPCLMLSGECDRHIIPYSSRKTAEYLPDCEYKNYPQVAHLFPWEIPQQVSNDVQDWLVRKSF